MEGWTQVPNVGTYVEADHPITTINPRKAFMVEHIEYRYGSWYVRGDETCWFNVKNVKPAAPENVVAAEVARLS